MGRSVEQGIRSGGTAHVDQAARPDRLERSKKLAGFSDAGGMPLFRPGLLQEGG